MSRRRAVPRPPGVPRCRSRSSRRPATLFAGRREFSWRDIAGETEVGSHTTARQYVETGEALFAWHVFHRVKHADRPAVAFKSPKKLYPSDPLVFHALHAWGSGAAEPWQAALGFLADPAASGRVVEGVVADHLRRALGRNCYYYRGPSDEEINFVAFRERTRVVAVEAKWGNRIGRSDWRALGERGGLLLTRGRLERLGRDPVTLAIPVYLFLALLKSAATLKPVGFGD